MIDGYLSSSFDLLNVADLDVIDQARSRCDRLTIGVFSDEYVERTMGRKPLVPLEERAALVQHVRGVEQVVVHDDVDLDRLSPGTVVFAVIGVEYEDMGFGEMSWIRPTRQTASAVVRQGLMAEQGPAAADPESAVA